MIDAHPDIRVLRDTEERTTTAKLKAAFALVFVGGLVLGLALGTNGIPGTLVANAEDPKGAEEEVSPTTARAREQYGREFPYPSDSKERGK